MPSTPKKPPSSPTTFRFVGPHAVGLDSGAPLGPGEYVTLEVEDQITPHNAEFITGGWLVDASGATTEPQSVETQSTEEEAPA